MTVLLLETERSQRTGYPESIRANGLRLETYRRSRLQATPTAAGKTEQPSDHHNPRKGHGTRSAQQYVHDRS